MDQDQERTYETEEEAFEQQDQEEMERQQREGISTEDYFIQLMDLLEKELNSASRIPLGGGRAVINLDDCLLILRDMQQNFPDALRMSRHNNSEKERITLKSRETAASMIAETELKTQKVLNDTREKVRKMLYDAQLQRDEMLQDAQERAEAMVSNHEIVRTAEEEARAIRSEARADAEDIRMKTSNAVYSLLSDVDKQLSDTLKEVRRMRNQSGLK